MFRYALIILYHNNLNISSRLLSENSYKKSCDIQQCSAVYIGDVGVNEFKIGVYW